MVQAQRIADENKKTHMFVWRGYKACVSSQIPKLTTQELKRRFNLAMKSVQDGEFKRPSQPSSSFSIPQTQLSQEVTQIPETQFIMEGKINS